MTDIHAPELWTPRKRWLASHEKHLRANPNIDAALLAVDLGVAEEYVRMMQRKLGLRKLTSPSKYRKLRK